MSIRPVYAEGICRRCRRRVTLPRRADHHWRDGQACGPVDTHSPMATAGVPTDTAWVHRARLLPAQGALA